MGYYIRCGKRLLKKKQILAFPYFKTFSFCGRFFVSWRTSFATFTFFIHVCVHSVIYTFPHTYSHIVSLCIVLLWFACHEIGYTELLKFYVNIMEILSECFIHVEMPVENSNCVYLFFFLLLP